MFKEKDNNTNVPVEIQEVVYCSGISRRPARLGLGLQTVYHDQQPTSLESFCLLLLAQGIQLFCKYLDRHHCKDQVRSQDVQNSSWRSCVQPSGTLLAWRHFLEDTGTSIMICSLVVSLGSHLGTTGGFNTSST